VSVLWILPLLLYAGGAVLVLSAARQAAEAGARLRAACGRLDDVRTELLQLRTETGTARAAVDRWHSRSVSRATRG
jgi:hypothetical protein